MGSKELAASKQLNAIIFKEYSDPFIVITSRTMLETWTNFGLILYIVEFYIPNDIPTVGQITPETMEKTSSSFPGNFKKF